MTFVYNVNIDDLLDALLKLESSPGRLDQIISNANVFVDYAHTDDALKNAILSLRRVYQDKKIITVFGCGGNRDSGKRPKMGAIACEYSDYCYVTSDNPRYEEPQKIIDDIIVGIHSKNYTIEINRDEAIKHAILNMDLKSDVLLIAGKGHEPYQEIRGIKYPFDDKEIATKYLELKI
jgi:UDP-N-acetylmuramoyl-L-alanyl-D-glutamate--2,6-diaminopimelate ligase